MAEFEDSKESALEALEELNSDSDFLLVAASDEGEYSFRCYSGRNEGQISLLNLTAVPLCYMHKSFEDYPISEAAEHVLTAARLQLQGGEITSSGSNE